MTRSRIILIVIAIALIAGLYALPRIVVENNPESMREGKEASPNDSLTAKALSSAHSTALSDQDLQRISQLKRELAVANNNKKSVIFADSLAGLYMRGHRYDSAAKFIEIIATLSPGQTSLKRAGDLYYEAFTTEMDGGTRQYLSEKARSYYQQALVNDPSDLFVKNRVAMTLLSSGNPMSGIMMLREVLEADPDNEQALFNLGVLSMQSGQYDKAVDRFEELKKVHPENLQGQFFLGVSYLNVGKKGKARKQFEWVKKQDADPEVQAAADSYLEELE